MNVFEYITDTLYFWKESFLFVDILVISPILIPVYSIIKFKQKNIKPFIRIAIVLIATVAEVVILYYPWSVMIREGVGEWMIYYGFCLFTTLMTFGPIAIFVMIITLIILKKTNKLRTKKESYKTKEKPEDNSSQS